MVGTSFCSEREREGGRGEIEVERAMTECFLAK
jgi:hypothetical protein